MARLGDGSPDQVARSRPPRHPRRVHVERRWWRLFTAPTPALAHLGSHPGDRPRGAPVRPESWRGEDAFEGADLAVNVLNRTLGPGRAQFELVSLDDRGSASRATQL